MKRQVFTIAIADLSSTSRPLLRNTFTAPHAPSANTSTFRITLPSSPCAAPPWDKSDADCSDSSLLIRLGIHHRCGVNYRRSSNRWRSSHDGRRCLQWQRLQCGLGHFLHHWFGNGFFGTLNLRLPAWVEAVPQWLRCTTGSCCMAMETDISSI